MTAQGELTEKDVATAREGVAAGRAVTLWFTAAAVGVPPGGSARVVAVGDTAEGEFIEVRPAGSRDTVHCSPSELTRTRPARRSTPPETAAATTAPEGGGVPRRRPSAGPRSRTGRPAETTVRLTTTGDGEWGVEVLVGAKVVVPAAPVQAAAMATVARSLPPAVAEVVASSLDGARRRQRDHVERLRAELDAAQQALEQLGV